MKRTPPHIFVGLKRLCVALLAMFIYVTGWAQTDSVPTPIVYKQHTRSFIAPAVVVGATTIIATNEHWGASFRHETQNMLTTPIQHETAWADYLRFVPMAATWGMYLTKKTRKADTHALIWKSVISISTMVVGTQLLKRTVRERRPDGSDNFSYPSGHTAMAFVGAQLLHQEFGKQYPWVAVAGYGVATATAWLRVRENKHYLSDVVGGAAVGIMSAQLAAWIYPRWIQRKKTFRPTSTVYVSPFWDNRQKGLCLQIAL